MRVVFSPEARQEFEEAERYYERQVPGLGARRFSGTDSTLNSSSCVCKSVAYCTDPATCVHLENQMVAGGDGHIIPPRVCCGLRGIDARPIFTPHEIAKRRANTAA